MQNLLLNFPEGYSPNKSQISILKKIESTINSGVKFVICNAPTGAGKSFIPMTLANSVDGPSKTFKERIDDYSMFGEDGASYAQEEDPFGCYVLTITKALQDQYKNTFNETGILKGQSNYQCAIDDTLSVDIAPCIYAKGLKNDCWKANKCPYYNERNSMLKSKFAALNYSMFFSIPDHLKKRKILVCDEGSELEDQLVSQFTCNVDIPFLVKTNTSVTSFPTQETPTKVVDWLSKLVKSVVSNIESYNEYFKQGKNDHIEFVKKKGEYSKLMNLQKSLDLLLGTYNDSQYLIEHVDKIIKFIPLKVDKLSKFLFDYADHVIIMSATIIDPANFCKNLGISDYKYIEVDSTFDSEKSPIHVLASQKINFQNMKEMLPKLVKQVQQILEEHKGEKGIIHTHTQYITDYIRENVNSSRLLCREAGVRNEELLDIHEQSKEPTVLVSPSMTYGVDLKGDLGKFQILLKAPWLPTKEIRVEKMMKLDKDWYSNKMLCTLVQACGRGIRSEDDECITYILDGSIFDAVSRNKKKLPKFFLDRFQ
jgi:Rad3-related DNA helicase